jgi:hypothetical protein
VFEVCDTQSAGFSSKPTRVDIALQHITNQIERTLIGFFGRNTLLNLQMGGTLSGNGIDFLYEDAFAKCNTKLGMNLDQDTEHLHVDSKWL